MSGFPVVWTVLGIGLLIFVHELGHFLAARLAGVRVETFSLGFGPRLLGARWRGTDYRLSLLPLGGYVKVAGDDPTDRRYAEPDDLQSQGFLARALFFSGGVLMNLVFALVVFPFVFAHGVEFTAPVLGTVTRGGPAWEADLLPGDRVRAINGKRTYSFENLQVEIALAGRREIVLEIERAGQVLAKRVTPRFSAAIGMPAIEIFPAFDPTPPTVTVQQGSPAEAAGLRTGDQLLQIAGQPITTRVVEEVTADMLRRPQTELVVQVARAGQVLDVRYTPRLGNSTDARIGVLRAQRRVVGIRGKALGLLDLRIGDHLLRVDGQTVVGPDLAAFAVGPEELRVEVAREGVPAPVAITRNLTPQQRRDLVENLALGNDQQGLVVLPQPASPAERAGLRSGDVIQAIQGLPIQTWAELRSAIQAPGTKKLTLTVARGGESHLLEIEPTTTLLQLGFDARGLYQKELYQVEGLLPAIGAGFVCSIDLVKQLYVTLKRLVTGEVAASNLGGIIQISVVTYEFAKSGWTRFLYFLALLSINLAFMNVLPIPVLDGGHLLFLLVERIKGSPVSPRVFNYGQVVGLVLLLALMVFVTFNDIRRLL